MQSCSKRCHPRRTSILMRTIRQLQILPPLHGTPARRAIQDVRRSPCWTLFKLAVTRSRGFGCPLTKYCLGEGCGRNAPAAMVAQQQAGRRRDRCYKTIRIRSAASQTRPAEMRPGCGDSVYLGMALEIRRPGALSYFVMPSRMCASRESVTRFAKWPDALDGTCAA